MSKQKPEAEKDVSGDSYTGDHKRVWESPPEVTTISKLTIRLKSQVPQDKLWAVVHEADGTVVYVIGKFNVGGSAELAWAFDPAIRLTLGRRLVVSSWKGSEYDIVAS